MLGIMALRRRISFYTNSSQNKDTRDTRRQAMEEARRREGEVSIDTDGRQQGKGGRDDDDYADYEEVK